MIIKLIWFRCKELIYRVSERGRRGDKKRTFFAENRHNIGFEKNFLCIIRWLSKTLQPFTRKHYNIYVKMSGDYPPPPALSTCPKSKCSLSSYWVSHLSYFSLFYTPFWCCFYPSFHKRHVHKLYYFGDNYISASFAAALIIAQVPR